MKNPQIKRYLYSKAALRHIPIGGTFELTPCCNMNCRMCYIRLSKEEQEKNGRLRTAEEWIKLGQVCRESGMLFLLLTGGEPFLRPDFREIYEGLYRMGLLLSINTNGTLITEETVEWLKESPPEKVNITLYGGSSAAYEKLCGYRDGYNKAVRAIRMLREAGIRVNVNVSFTQENAEEQEKIFAFLEKYDLPSKMTSYMFPPVRKWEEDCEAEGKRMSPERAGELLWKAEQFKYRKGLWEERKQKLLTGMPEEIGDCPVDEKMRCMAGRSVFWVTWDWKLRSCGMMMTPSIPVETESFMQAWQKIGEQIDTLRLPKECSVCEFRSVCPVCGAAVQSEGNGNMEEKPEYLCRLTQEFVKCIRRELKETGEVTG